MQYIVKDNTPRQILGNKNVARINLPPSSHHNYHPHPNGGIMSSTTMKQQNITDLSYSNCLLLGKETTASAATAAASTPYNTSVHSSTSMESSQLSWTYRQNIFPVTTIAATTTLIPTSTSTDQQCQNHRLQQQQQPQQQQLQQQQQLAANRTDRMLAHVDKISNDEPTKYTEHLENNSSNLLFNFKSSFSFNQHSNNQDIQNQQPTTITQNNANIIGSPSSDYDDKDVPIISNNEGIIKNSDPFIEITQLAMRGCEVAEPIAHRYSNRPCFKKIDCLCARLKQDLVRPDGVLANINSQGIAWAIKDLIFVFTRIINAWIIVKGYVNQPPNRIRPALATDFNDVFFEWQNSTKKFIERLIKSFINLDQIEKLSNIPSQKLQKTDSSRLVQEKYCWSAISAAGGSTTGVVGGGGKINGGELLSPLKSQLSPIKLSGRAQSDDNFCGGIAGGGAGGDPMQNDLFNNFSPNSSSSSQNGFNYLSNLNEDSEEIQRKAMQYETYIKTGLYTPLKCDGNQNYAGGIINSYDLSKQNEQKLNNLNTSPVKTQLPQQQQQPHQFNNNHQHHFHQIQQEYYLQNSKFVSSTSSKSLVFPEQKPKSNDSLFSSTIEFNNNNLNEILPQQQQQQPTPQQQMETFKLKEKYLLNKIQNLNESKYFFFDQFTKNYFPDFLTIVPNYTDIRNIVLKHEYGGYENIFAIVYDLQQIIFSAKLYLKKRPHLFLNNSILAFEKGFHDILNEHTFADFDFSHIIITNADVVTMTTTTTSTAGGTSAAGGGTASGLTTNTQQQKNNGNINYTMINSETCTDYSY